MLVPRGKRDIGGFSSRDDVFCPRRLLEMMRPVSNFLLFLFFFCELASDVRTLKGVLRMPLISKRDR